MQYAQDAETAMSTLEIALIVALVVEAIICGSYCSYVAWLKGYDGFRWFFGGLVFNIVALIAIAGMPMVANSVKNIYADSKTCPKCAERVRKPAEVCRYCGNIFKEDTAQKPKEKPLEAPGLEGSTMIAFIIVIILIIGAAIYLRVCK